MSCPPVHLERSFITAHLNYKLDIISFSSQCFLPLCSGRWLGFLEILWVLSEMLNPGVDFIGALCSVHDYLMFPLYTGLQSYMFQSPKSVLPLVLEQHHPEVSKSLNPVQVFLESFILFSYFLPCVLPPLLPPNPNNSALCLVQTKPFTEIFSLFFFCFDITLLSGNCVRLFHMFSFSLNMARLLQDSQSLFSKSQAAVHRLLLHLWNPFYPSTKHRALQFNYWAKNRSLA